MTTTQETYAVGFTRQKQNDIQRKAVEDYLEEHREINRDFAFNVGIPACGRIKNLPGRIHELRAEGWDIKTDIRDGVCWYVLVAAPQPKTLEMKLLTPAAAPTSVTIKAAAAEQDDEKNDEKDVHVWLQCVEATSARQRSSIGAGTAWGTKMSRPR